ncbi:Uncharacterised protein [Enterobacter hormaechei]|nr:Uncharacterised protein [Enterobacter hormaechei]
MPPFWYARSGTTPSFPKMPPLANFGIAGMPPVPSDADPVRLLNPELEPDEPDPMLSKPPPAQADTSPEAMVAPKLNHLLPEPDMFAPSMANAAESAPVTELRFCMEKMDVFTALVSASLASVLVNSPFTQLPIALVAEPIALVVC